VNYCFYVEHVVFVVFSHFLPKHPHPMTIEINDHNRQGLIASIQRYFQENMDEPIGNLAAGALLTFFMKELGPLVYNKAVVDVQGRLQARIAEIDLEVYEDEFQFWNKSGVKKKAK
jgi:uncharacterized protein (DUF2164 family)